jgi:hypothetical protein
MDPRLPARTRRLPAAFAEAAEVLAAGRARRQRLPPVARVDNVYGDKNVMCACIPVDAYKDEVEA